MSRHEVAAFLPRATLTTVSRDQGTHIGAFGGTGMPFTRSSFASGMLEGSNGSHCGLSYKASSGTSSTISMRAPRRGLNVALFPKRVNPAQRLALRFDEKTLSEKASSKSPV